MNLMRTLNFIPLELAPWFDFYLSGELSRVFDSRSISMSFFSLLHEFLWLLLWQIKGKFHEWIDRWCKTFVDNVRKRSIINSFFLLRVKLSEIRFASEYINQFHSSSLCCKGWFHVIVALCNVAEWKYKNIISGYVDIY